MPTTNMGAFGERQRRLARRAGQAQNELAQVRNSQDQRAALPKGPNPSPDPADQQDYFARMNLEGELAKILAELGGAAPEAATRFSYGGTAFAGGQPQSAALGTRFAPTTDPSGGTDRWLEQSARRSAAAQTSLLEDAARRSVFDTPIDRFREREAEFDRQKNFLDRRQGDVKDATRTSSAIDALRARLTGDIGREEMTSTADTERAIAERDYNAPAARAAREHQLGLASIPWQGRANAASITGDYKLQAARVAAQAGVAKEVIDSAQKNAENLMAGIFQQFDPADPKQQQMYQTLFQMSVEAAMRGRDAALAPGGAPVAPRRDPGGLR